MYTCRKAQLEVEAKIPGREGEQKKQTLKIHPAHSRADMNLEPRTPRVLITRLINNPISLVDYFWEAPEAVGRKIFSLGARERPRNCTKIHIPRCVKCPREHNLASAREVEVHK